MITNQLYFILALNAILFLGVFFACKLFQVRVNLLRLFCLVLACGAVVQLFFNLPKLRALSVSHELYPYLFLFFVDLFFGLCIILFLCVRNGLAFPLNSIALGFVSLLLAGITLAGVSIDQEGSFFTGNQWVSLYSLIVIIGLYFYFYYLGSYLFMGLNKLGAQTHCRPLVSMGINTPTRVGIAVFITLNILWLPYVIGWSFDTLPQGVLAHGTQVAGDIDFGCLGSKALCFWTFITNSNPIVQIFLITLSFSVIYAYFWKIGFPRWYFIIVSILFLFLPIYPIYTGLIAKDIIPFVGFMMFVLALFSWIRSVRFANDYKMKFSFWIMLFTIASVVVFFMDAGIYIVVGSLFLVFCFVSRARKQSLSLLLAICALFYVLNSLLFPSLKVTSFQHIDLFSFSFQQTARHVKYDKKSFTLVDKKVINSVLPFSELKALYDPKSPDRVKDRYNQNVTKEEFNNYLKLWFGGFVKRPGLYMDATFENVYLFYMPLYADPGFKDDTTKFLKAKNSEVKNLGGSYKLTHEELVALVYRGFACIPVIGLLSNPGFSTWIVIIFFSYLLYKKSLVGTVSFSPFLIFVVFYSIHPNNGVISHAMPIIYSIPLMLGIVVFASLYSKSSCVKDLKI